MAIDLKNLRDELQEITDRYADDRVAEQILRIAKLNPRFSHTISLLQAVMPDKPETFQFNCYQYSFALRKVESVTRIMQEHWLSPRREFGRFLLDTRLQGIPANEAQDGDHIIYEDPEIVHAGIVREGRIESKWGLGHLWHHGVFEVPWRYGTHVRYFRRLAPGNCVDAFLEYATERGVYVA
jgi:hypothetical protein